jgi:glycosyltransferase involved in cell wall biosynthesis
VKVLVLSSYAPTLFFFREDMMKAMIENGHEVIAAAPESEEEWANKFREKNIKYISIKGIDRTGTNPIKDFIGFISILKAILKEKPDKIFTYQAKTIIYGCIAARLLNVKEIYALMGGLGSVFRNNDRKSLARDILKFEYKVAFKYCKKVFFQNKDDSKEILEAGLIKEKQIIMINGSGVNLFKFTKKAIPLDTVFLFVGRIIRDKGIIEYLEAAKIVKEKYPNTRIQIVGYFDTNPTAISEEEINEYVKNGIVEYLGPTDNVIPFLEKSSVYVLPSYHEGTPKSVLEAMATGRPIITTDAPGCRETVEDGVNGYLIPIKDTYKLAEKMVWMIEHKAESVEMGEQSYRICKEKFDVNKVNEVILKTMNL